jgi:hypothetical protein
VLSGPFQQNSLKQLANLNGWSAKCLLINVATGVDLLSAAAASIDSFDQASGTAQVSYPLASAPTLPIPAGVYKLKWRLIDGSGRKMHAPAPADAQTLIRFS